MTRWDSDNLNAAHTARELEQEWRQTINCEIGSGNVFADLGFENEDELTSKSEIKGLRDRIEQLERDLAVAGGLNYDLRQQLQDQSILRESFEEELAAEKALADRLAKRLEAYSDNNKLSFDAMVLADYRKARGL